MRTDRALHGGAAFLPRGERDRRRTPKRGKIPTSFQRIRLPSLTPRFPWLTIGGPTVNSLITFNSPGGLRTLGDDRTTASYLVKCELAGNHDASGVENEVELRIRL